MSMRVSWRQGKGKGLNGRKEPAANVNINVNVQENNKEEGTNSKPLRKNSWSSWWYHLKCRQSQRATLKCMVAIPLFFLIGMLMKRRLPNSHKGPYEVVADASADRFFKEINKVHSKPLPTAATHPRPPTPFKCGVLIFYHIPITGGSSITNWLEEYALPENGNIPFFDSWGTRRDSQEKVQKSFIDGMNAHVSNLGKNEWRSGQLHLANPPLNTTEHHWYQWRSTVEKQGCQMINAIMLRDPLNHAMAGFKLGQGDDWFDRRLPHTSQLSFFLYNNDKLIGQNPYNVTKEEKVQRGIELLQRHFDVVSVGDHTQFMNKILKYTGWKHLDMPYTNVHHRTLDFTKKEVESLYKLLVRNGDVDFVDAVKLRYSGHLSYLSGF